jgi:TolB-like protein/aminoglycoside phosphotransferase (APT) family kinase protein/tetratricopeptide (TPR) repeat protein
LVLSAGTRLGPYEIVAPLGVGGMGEVYRARDARLGREVAVKVLPESLASDGERLRRFEQEARSASALNHPNIVTIHDVGQTDGRSWIAMEFVDGASLRQLFAGGALPIKRALAIATQIAEGLARAHASGIVHRDLKPENVMMTNDGLVKILDFGLAKAANPPAPDASQVATATQQTEAGIVLGTVGYMSPEQATSRAVDHRSDQFALGAILYEMATGRRAFQAASAVETLSKILKEEPEPLAKVQPDAPESLVWIVERCLAKEPDERYQSTRDLARDLAGVRDRTSGAQPASTPLSGRGGKRRRFEIAALVVAALLAGAFALWRARPQGGEVRSLAVLPLKPLSSDAMDEALGLGISDTIIRGLSRTEGVTVRPLSAVRKYAKADVDAVGAAKELKADAVLEGSVQRASGKLRVSVNLLRAGDGRSIWTESFDVPESEVFELEDSVSNAVVTRLRLHLAPDQRDRMNKRFTQNTEAYEQFVIGSNEFGKCGPGWGGEHLDESIRRFERATALDPNYALAHASLGQAYLWRDLFFRPGAGDLEKAKAEAADADRLDPQLAETHMVRYQLEWSHYNNFDVEAAMRELSAARKIDPMSAHDETTILLAHMGLEDAFRRESMAGRQIDPSSGTMKRFSVEGLVLLGHADEALAVAKAGDVPPTDSRLPMALLMKGRYGEARAAADLLLKEQPGHHNAVALRELVAVLSGERSANEAAIAGAIESGKLLRDYHHTLYSIACIRAAQGDAKGAVDMLRKTVATGMPDRTLFLRDPLLEKVRKSPEFAAFDAELEPVWRRYENEWGEGAKQGS